MKTIFKSTLLTVTICVSINAEVSISEVGTHIGLGYTPFSKTDSKGSIANWNEPESSLFGVDFYGIFDGVFENKTLKPYVSYTYTSNEQISHQYFLGGINKYYPHDDIVYYTGAYVGWGILRWQTNPITGLIEENENEKATSNAFILGIQGGIKYPISKKLSYDFNIKAMGHDHSTIIEPSSTQSSRVDHKMSMFGGFGISYSF